MNNPRGFAFTPLLLTIIIVLVLSAGAYFVLHKQKSQELLSVYLHPAATSTVTTNPNQGSDQTPTRANYLGARNTVGPAPLTVTFIPGFLGLGDNPIFFGDGAQADATCAEFKPDTDACIRMNEVTHTYVGAGTYHATYVEKDYGDSKAGEGDKVWGSVTVTATDASASQVSVPGMRMYTDSDFGFSFWYPTGWTVSKSNVRLPSYVGDSFVQTLVVSNGTRSVLLAEYDSPSGITYSFAKAYGVVYFDKTLHTWMDNDHWSPTQGLGNYSPKAADVSLNTMGGLHIIGSQIIPLSARKFVVIDQGGVDSSPLLLGKTIVALDPAVATPVSASQQTTTIQAEKEVYSPSTQSGGNSTYTSSKYGVSISYPKGSQIDTSRTSLIEIGPITKGVQLSDQGWGTNGFITIIGHVIVRVNANPTDVANCLPSGNISHQNINGIDFAHYDTSEPAAGLEGLDSIYTAKHNGLCYSIDSSIEGAESGHMSVSDGALNNAATAQLAAELDSIAQSFRFQ